MVLSWNKAIVQVLYVGALAFCCPGMFNALTGLGNAGTSDSRISAAANAALYGTFCVFGYFGGASFNLFGNKILMLVGGLTYAVYAICSYCAGRYHDVKWVAIIGGAVLGCGAGWFWTAQGAMMMAYAAPEVRGKYISYFWIVFNLGATIGGILMFGMNYNKTEADEANPASYFTFVAVMAAGGLGALLLAAPSTVEREDGEPVRFEKAKSAWEEIKDALGVATNKYMILLALPFFCSNWFYTYQFQGFNAIPFNIRTRGLNSALYWAAQMLGAFLFGRMMDRPNLRVRTRAWFGLAACVVLFNLANILGAIVLYNWRGGFERNAPPIPLWDVKASAKYWYPCIVYILYGGCDAIIQTYSYWLMATIAGRNGTLCAQFAGFYKGVQSAGACISWAIDLRVKYRPQFWIQWALVVASFPLMAMVAYRIEGAIAENEAKVPLNSKTAETPERGGSIATGVSKQGNTQRGADRQPTLKSTSTELKKAGVAQPVDSAAGAETGAATPPAATPAASAEAAEGAVRKSVGDGADGVELYTSPVPVSAA